MPSLGFWSSCRPQHLMPGHVVEATGLQRTATHPPAPLQSRKLRTTRLPGPRCSITSRVVGLEPWSHFSASSTLTIRLAASLGLGHKEPIDLPGHYRSGRSCREVCVAAVMRWGSEPDGSITESFAEKPEGRDPIGNKVGGSRRHAEGSGASQQWGLEGPRHKGSTAAGHLAAALAVPSASPGAAHGPGTHPLPTPI